MNFTFKRDLVDQVFSTQIVCSALGDASLTAEQEQDLINDFGPVTVDIGGTYSGKYKVDTTTGNIEVDTAATSDNITFVVSNMKVELKANVAIPFSIDAKKISADEMATHATDTFKDLPLKVAEAKCLIFEQAIETKIKNILKDFKAKTTTFPTNTPSDFQA